MRRLRTFLLLPFIAYNWPVILALMFLDVAGVDLRPQGEATDFSFKQTLVLFLVASFFSTLFYIIFKDTLLAMIRDYPAVPYLPF
jgi:hypothetical protein